MSNKGKTLQDKCTGIIIYYVYFYRKDYRNDLYKVSTQICSFERVFIFQYKGLYCYALIYIDML